MSTPPVSRSAKPILPVMIIGVSGATWSVIDPMTSDGALPALQKLKREGAWGVLKSLKTEGDKHYRPQTAWASLLSGKLPEKHGIMKYFQTRDDLRSKCIWDFFTEKGLTAGLFAGHAIWPPPKINGFVIPYPYARDDKTWPEDLSYIMSFYRYHQDYKRRLSYARTLMKSLRFIPALFGQGQDCGLSVRLLRSAMQLAMERDSERKALTLRFAKLDFSTAMFLSLYRKYEPHFSIFTNFEVDYVSHRYWRYHEPEKFPDPDNRAPGLRRSVRDIYAHMDACVRLLLKRLPAECIVAFVSEHGMGAEVSANEIGRWQYLIRGNSVKALAGIGDDIIAVPIARWVVFRRKDGKPLDSGVERVLNRLTVLETGLPLFTVQRNKEEVIIKLSLHRSDYEEMEDIGDLHVDIVGKEIVPIGRLLYRAGPARSAMHAKEGVVIIKGPGIRSDRRIDEAVITDIMPTLLFASGIEVPSDLDGRVLDVFT